MNDTEADWGGHDMMPSVSAGHIKYQQLNRKEHVSRAGMESMTSWLEAVCSTF